MKFPNLSPPDFNLKLQNNIEILMNNVLYMTHEIDHIKKVVNMINNSLRLQKQVDEYFEETSPQTEQVNTDSNRSD